MNSKSNNRWTHYIAVKLADCPKMFEKVKEQQMKLIEAFPFLANIQSKESYLHVNWLVLQSNSSKKIEELFASDSFKPFKSGKYTTWETNADNKSIYIRLTSDTFECQIKKLQKLLKKQKIDVTKNSFWLVILKSKKNKKSDNSEELKLVLFKRKHGFDGIRENEWKEVQKYVSQQEHVSLSFGYRKLSLISKVDSAVLQWRVLAPATEGSKLNESEKMFAHTKQVTSVCIIPKTGLLATSSRDCKIILWQTETGEKSKPVRSLSGHSHFIQQVVSTNCGKYILSASWDKSARMWSVENGICLRRFIGHTKEVTSVSISKDNRIVITSSKDCTIRIWNTNGECKAVVEGLNCHKEWISCVNFISDDLGDKKLSSECRAKIVSSGWDSLTKIWNFPPISLKTTFKSASNYLTCQAISPDNSITATAGKDGIVFLYALDTNKIMSMIDLRSFVEADSKIFCIQFNPTKYFLTVGLYGKLLNIDLELKKITHQATINRAPFSPGLLTACLSLCWSEDGNTLFCGCDDSSIRVFTTN